MKKLFKLKARFTHVSLGLEGRHAGHASDCHIMLIAVADVKVTVAPMTFIHFGFHVVITIDSNHMITSSSKLPKWSTSCARTINTYFKGTSYHMHECYQ